MNEQQVDVKSQSGKGDQFSSAGFIMAAIGSAVGLGNMWRFPFITGKYGGAAFFFLFVVCLFIIGLPLLLAELAIGRQARSSAGTVFTKVGAKKGWKILGIIQVVSPLLLLSFYAIVSGWTMHYAYLSLKGSFSAEGVSFANLFKDFNAGYVPMLWQVIVLLITGWIVARGVSGGIEKLNNILIPSLVVLLVLLMIRAVTLPGGSEGVSFFLNPDFSKLSSEAALAALGHAFFSLSIGMGTMITYGAYVQKHQPLGLATLAIGGGNLLYAFIAGLIVFPIIFAFQIEPTQGPALLFVALPQAFASMPMGSILGAVFFILLAMAALTTTVSLIEVPAAYVMERWKCSRPRAVWGLLLVCFLLGVPSALSNGAVASLSNIAGRSFFDWVDFHINMTLLPITGLALSIFFGYVWKDRAEAAGITAIWFRVWVFALRYVCPLLLLVLVLESLGILSIMTKWLVS